MSIISFAFRKLIKVREAAERLALDEQTIYGHKGGTEKLTRVKMGRAVRLVEDEVDSLVEKKIKESS